MEVISASEWKKKSRNLTTCPSGAVVVIRRISLATLAMSGRVPEVLLGSFLEGIKALDELQGNKNKEDITPSQLAKSTPVMDAVIIAALESPRVVLDNPQDDEICVRDIPDEDRLFIFNQALKGSPSVPVEMEGGEVSVDDLQTFREDGEFLSTGEDGEGVQSEAVAAIGN